MEVINIAILGDREVGKTALIHQLSLQMFTQEYDPTVEEVYRIQLQVDGRRYLLRILDTGTQEYSLYKCDGFILVYSISSEPSFRHIRDLHNAVIASLAQTTRHIPQILIGNKIDDRRAVSIEEGLLLAQELRCPFFEASAKIYSTVNEPFYNLVRQIKRGAGPVPCGEDSRTSPKQPLISQEYLAGDNEQQSPLNLQVPRERLRKRSSTDAVREQSLPQKRGTTDSSRWENMIEPDTDEGETELLNMLDLMAQMKLERQQKAETRGYVQKDIIERESLSDHFCASCDGVSWRGKCDQCLQTECLSWLKQIPGPQQDTNSNASHELWEFLGIQYCKNQKRIEEREREFIR
ncbi:P-loop containing nucleoside triphosphate hydrolase protein [Tricladium varicosporioides]|nr:P-loop containing nucleoside triphosphate hydrolase protein [Hymenoscyphus varicosporioides]